MNQKITQDAGRKQLGDFGQILLILMMMYYLVKTGISQELILKRVVY